MSKEIPILFSTPMVKAILEGRKTMTRRIVKFPKDFDGKAVFQNGQFGLKYSSNEFDGCVHRLFSKWQVGDILWVRENFKVQQVNRIHDGEWINHVCLDFVASEGGKTDDFRKWFYIPEKDCSKVLRRKHPTKVFVSPSIFLPKECSRIWLEVTDVKVERVQSISNNDALAEGIESVYEKGLFGQGYVRPDRALSQSPESCFEHLWQSINGKESWKENPYVWVISFKVISKHE